jgi:hypothetical protein
MSDRSRQTSNVIKKLTSYFKQSTPPSGVDEKLGDIWFDETTRGVVGSGKPLPSIQKTIDKRKKEKAERPPVKISKLSTVSDRKKDKAERPSVKIPKIKKKRSL